MNPKLTIGLPVYNGARYLSESLDALLSQDWGDFELLISDNASTDGTADIATAFARKDSRIRFVRQPTNLGAAANFNYVFRMGSEAPYFKWACADDAVLPGFLGQAVTELDHHPETVLCYGQIRLVDGDGHFLENLRQGWDLRSPDELERFRTARAYRGLLNVLQGVMPTRALRQTRLMGAFPGSDETLAAELTLQGTFRELQAPMLNRRMHSDAASADKSVEARQTHLKPESRGRLHLDTWRRTNEHLRAILRAPLSFRQRLRLLAFMMRAMVVDRKALRWELTSNVRIVLARFGRRSPLSSEATHD